MLDPSPRDSDADPGWGLRFVFRVLLTMLARGTPLELEPLPWLAHMLSRPETAALELWSLTDTQIM